MSMTTTSMSTTTLALTHQASVISSSSLPTNEPGPTSSIVAAARVEPPICPEFQAPDWSSEAFEKEVKRLFQEVLQAFESYRNESDGLLSEGYADDLSEAKNVLKSYIYGSLTPSNIDSVLTSILCVDAKFNTACMKDFVFDIAKQNNKHEALFKAIRSVYSDSKDINWAALIAERIAKFPDQSQTEHYKTLARIMLESNFDKPSEENACPPLRNLILAREFEILETQQIEAVLRHMLAMPRGVDFLTIGYWASSEQDAQDLEQALTTHRQIVQGNFV